MCRLPRPAGRHGPPRALEDPTGDVAAQPTLPAQCSAGDGRGDGAPRAAAGPAMEEHPCHP